MLLKIPAVQDALSGKIQRKTYAAAEQDTKRRLHSTIGNLNRSRETRLIHFQGGGDGKSVSWRLLRNLAASDDTAKTQRM